MKKRRYLQGSIKEAVDNLPSGICFFAQNGLLILCNRTMYRLVFAISGHDLQTLEGLKKMLKQLPEGSPAVRDGEVILLPDGSAWKFLLEIITDEYGTPYTQAAAFEVSDIHRASEELASNIEKLKETQERIRGMTRNIAAITRENEILSMKMRIHDELGSSLLKLRRYYLGTDSGSKEELLANWKKTVCMLKCRSGGEDEEDPIADLLHSAEAIGVEIIRSGEMPEDVAAARLIVWAIRQCLTNAVRHAGGNRIFVDLSRNGCMATAVITNDGEPPKSEIVEGSGLSSLRIRIEKAGGTMEVQSLPEFALMVTVPAAAGLNEREM